MEKEQKEKKNKRDEKEEKKQFVGVDVAKKRRMQRILLERSPRDLTSLGLRFQ
jgi:hypothetical protein